MFTIHQTKNEPRRPYWTGAAGVAVMLLAGCDPQTAADIADMATEDVAVHGVSIEDAVLPDSGGGGGGGGGD